ncbi:FAD-binding oxidoreductase [Paenibacillus sp. GSMTC-2017]|uniref:NAD(P)/FAD-dependent oxidoreductase n=1 Tax=Paenibacillus sp. GSMTC-2017 TaxID=2794350 RepID=UPI0018D95F74|nr:FAD-dependent oxidoreductase [Paenibacillus sp. GSMTC-2017]MBH5320010.1 FAD-binding oxidoreductase [Paenibacillus sp. GSMTC-2017]
MKELHTGRLYWPTTLAVSRNHTSLKENIKTTVAIVGGGMSGVTCAYVLASGGMDVVLIERGKIAEGSTSANTGLLQFCNDVMLVDLIKQIGRGPAETFYTHCKKAVEQLAAVAQSLPVDVGYRDRSSLYFASSEQDLPKLKKEYEALAACGFDVEYWTPDKIALHFPFRKSGAIVTHGDAEVNPYQFVNGLTDAAQLAGTRIFEETDVNNLQTLEDGIHHLHTSLGYTIEAEHVIYAVGYEPEELRGRLVKANLNRSYAIVTGVQSHLESWHKRFMLWETARPYLYTRTTIDDRIVVGGLDEETEQPVHSQQTISRRSKQLMEKLLALFPDIQPTVEYEWSATFGESQDNLPFIGEDPKWPNVYYSLGYGGNGTVYSMIAAHLLLDLIQGKGGQHPLTEIVSLSRASLTDS